MLNGSLLFKHFASVPPADVDIHLWLFVEVPFRVMMIAGLPVMIIKFGTLEVKSMSGAYVCLRTGGFQGASPFFSLRCFKKTAAPYKGFWP